MTSIFRIFNPDFDLPPTVANFGVEPASVPTEVEMKDLDKRLHDLAVEGIAQRRQQRSEQQTAQHS